MLLLGPIQRPSIPTLFGHGRNVSKLPGCLRACSLEHTKGVVTSDRRGTAQGGLLRDETHDLGSDGERDAAYRQRLAGLGLA